MIANEAEVRVTAALAGNTHSVGRLAALAETLTAGLVDTAGLTALNHQLDSIARARHACLTWAQDVDMAGAAFACAVSRSPAQKHWLAWVLSARLGDNLCQRVMPGAGYTTTEAYGVLRRVDHDRDVSWLDEMPERFWELLERRGRCCPDDLNEVCRGPRNPDYPRGGVRSLFDEPGSDDDGPCTRTVLTASDPATPAGVLKALANSNDVVVLDLVASHPNTSLGVLLKLSRGLVVHAARSRVTPADDRAVKMRAVQNNNNDSVWLLTRLAKNPQPEVRAVAARDPLMPPTTLKRLSGDYASLVRQCVALNESTPHSVLGRLSEDSEMHVRRCVAANRSCAPEILVALAADRLRFVRARAVANPTLPAEVAARCAGDRAQAVRAAVAARTDTGSETLAVLAGDAKCRVTRAVASNPNCPADVLERLAHHDDYMTRGYVGANGATPHAVLETLAADPEFWVRSEVAGNGALGAALFADTATADTGIEAASVIVRLAENPATAPRMLTRIATGDREWMRRCVATNPATPVPVLQRLAGDEYPGVRGCVAANPNTVTAILESLRRDANPWVRARAADSLKARHDAQPQEEGDPT